MAEDPSTVSVEIDDLALSYAGEATAPSPIPQNYEPISNQGSVSPILEPRIESYPTPTRTEDSHPTSQSFAGGNVTAPRVEGVYSSQGSGLPPRVQTPSLAEFAASTSTYEPLPEDFFKTIFYFSGMGRVIGTALNEGVYVEERQREKAIDTDQLPAHLREQLHRDEYPLVISCRNQAHNLYNGLKNLHSLLDQVPSYTDSNRPVTYRPASTGPVDVSVDDPIHGHKYFRDNRMRDSLGERSE